MPSICAGVDFDTIAREWRCKWTEDSDKASLQEVQKALDDVTPKLGAVAGVKHVQRVVCGGCHDFKVSISMPADKFPAWEEAAFAPEADFLEAVKKIKGVTAVETQTYTTMPVKLKRPVPVAPLKKARTFNIGKLKPDSKGFTLTGNVLGEPKAVEGKGAAKLFEVCIGDETGKVTCSLKDFQLDAIKGAKAVTLRNARVVMVGGHIRAAVDKWGKLESSEDTVETVGDKDVSEKEFELVNA